MCLYVLVQRADIVGGIDCGPPLASGHLAPQGSADEIEIPSWQELRLSGGKTSWLTQYLDDTLLTPPHPETGDMMCGLFRMLVNLRACSLYTDFHVRGCCRQGGWKLTVFCYGTSASELRSLLLENSLWCQKDINAGGRQVGVGLGSFIAIKSALAAYARNVVLQGLMHRKRRKIGVVLTPHL